MTDIVTATEPVAAKSVPICWICNLNPADSGEHKTKRSDLLDVLGKPTQAVPFYYHDLHKANRPVKSLDAKILKSPARICAYCNNTRTQPHDRAWERMSDCLRERRPAPKIGDFVRGNRIFGYNTRREMLNVHLFFLKLFGCMLCEAVDKNLPIDIAPFSKAIMTGRAHPEIYLQFGKCDGTIGRSNLHCWKTSNGCVLAGWLYEIDTVAVGVMFAQAGKFENPAHVWYPRTGSNRFQIADFEYKNRRVTDDGQSEAIASIAGGLAGDSEERWS